MRGGGSGPKWEWEQQYLNPLFINHLRTLLRFFAPAQNSTLLFSIDSALFDKKRGVGYILQAKSLSPCGPISGSRPYLVTSLLHYFVRRSWRERIPGQRAKM